MIEIKAAALYTKADLEIFLEEAGVDVDHFLSRVRCPKKFRNLWYGEDLIQALQAVPPLSEGEKKELPSAPRKRQKKARGELIGNVFTPSELGIRQS